MEVRMNAEGVLIVRAEVQNESDHKPFDEWYGNEHLSEALAAFKAERAWRSWSKIEPNVHYAFYEFCDVDSALRILGSSELKILGGKFDKIWGSRVIRTREVLERVKVLS